MFYRRKILLALIEAFGGSLRRTDCLKLLFLLCHRTTQRYYDFFPHKYGCFSFIAYQDKTRLEDLGYLSNQYGGFRKSADETFIDALRDDDRQAILDLSDEFLNKKGRVLLREVYLGYPYYASRSLIAEKVLDPDELEKVPKLDVEKASCLFTTGYEGLSIDAFLNKLIRHNIHAIIDVRKNPLSMKYGFSKMRLKSFLGKVGISYYHLPGLGIPSELRANLDTPEDYRSLFELYKNQILAKQTTCLEEVQSLTEAVKRAALLCFESDHDLCHRGKIAEHFQNSKRFAAAIRHI